MKILFQPRNLSTTYFRITLILLIVHVVTSTLNLAAGNLYPFLIKLNAVTNILEEHNLPTLFTYGLWLSCAYYIFRIAQQKNMQSLKNRWLFLGCVFVFLGVDEVAILHERLARPTREVLSADGVFFWAWIIPYGVASFFLIYSYRKFFFALEKHVQKLFLLAAVFFLGASLGLEMVEGFLQSKRADSLDLNIALSLVEEVCEILGLVIFLKGLILALNVYRDEQLAIDPTTTLAA